MRQAVGTKEVEVILEFSMMDALSLLFFAASWGLYHYIVELSPTHEIGLNTVMDGYRLRWMENMRIREVRIVDTQIMGSLQNGTAFFASTSLLAIGASATLLRATDDVLQVFRDLPFGLITTRALWEIKAAGLMVIFGYAFFKFSWSYRLFNYAAILLGATPPWNSPDVEERNRTALRASHMNIVAGRHFNRGQRAFFFALAYLGWFIGPAIFCFMTAFVLIVMWLRQFRSDALKAVLADGTKK